jgi:hypothetical protein
MCSWCVARCMWQPRGSEGGLLVSEIEWFIRCRRHVQMCVCMLVLREQWERVAVCKKLMFHRAEEWDAKCQDSEFLTAKVNVHHVNSWSSMDER